MDLFQPLQNIYIKKYVIQSCRERCVIYIQANKIKNETEWSIERERERATDRNRKKAHSSNEKFISINYKRMENLKREKKREREMKKDCQ